MVRLHDVFICKFGYDDKTNCQRLQHCWIVILHVSLIRIKSQWFWLRCLFPMYSFISFEQLVHWYFLLYESLFAICFFFTILSILLLFKVYVATFKQTLKEFTPIFDLKMCPWILFCLYIYMFNYDFEFFFIILTIFVIFDKSPSFSVRWIPFLYVWEMMRKLIISTSSAQILFCTSVWSQNIVLSLSHTIPFLNQGTKFTLWSLVIHITDNGMWIVLSFSYRYITKSVVNFLFSFFVWLPVLQQWHFPFLIFFSICSICSSLFDANSYKLNKKWTKMIFSISFGWLLSYDLK